MSEVNIKIWCDISVYVCLVFWWSFFPMKRDLKLFKFMIFDEPYFFPVILEFLFFVCTLSHFLFRAFYRISKIDCRCVRACVCNCSCVCVWVDVNLKFFRLNNYIFPHYFQYYNFTLKHNNQNLIFQYLYWINDIFDLNNFEIRLLSE